MFRLFIIFIIDLCYYSCFKIVFPPSEIYVKSDIKMISYFTIISQTFHEKIYN